MAQAAKKANILIITGVSKGLGLALANEFISQKWLVFGCARSQASIDELNKKYPNNSNKDIPFFSKIDATDNESIQEWADKIIDAYGAPTIVFANAGVAQKRTILENTEPKTFDTIIDVNIKGPFYLARAFLPSMKKANKASAVLGMTSGAGRGANGFFAAYACSKWGLEGLFLSLAAELEGTNIMAASYSPGMIGTDMFATASGAGKNVDSIGMPTAVDFAKETFPHLIKLLENVKEHNGKQITTPIMTDPKYKDQISAAIKVWNSNQNGNNKADGNSDAKQDA